MLRFLLIASAITDLVVTGMLVNIFGIHGEFNSLMVALYGAVGMVGLVLIKMVVVFAVLAYNRRGVAIFATAFWLTAAFLSAWSLSLA